MRLVNAVAATAIAFDMGALRGRTSRLRNLYAYDAAQETVNKDDADSITRRWPHGLIEFDTNRSGHRALLLAGST